MATKSCMATGGFSPGHADRRASIQSLVMGHGMNEELMIILLTGVQTHLQPVVAEMAKVCGVQNVEEQLAIFSLLLNGIQTHLQPVMAEMAQVCSHRMHNLHDRMQKSFEMERRDFEKRLQQADASSKSQGKVEFKMMDDELEDESPSKMGSAEEVSDLWFENPECKSVEESNPRRLFQTIFADLVSQGVAPNEAAVKALAAAKEETSRPRSGSGSGSAAVGKAIAAAPGVAGGYSVASVPASPAPETPAPAELQKAKDDSQALMHTIFTEFVNEGMSPTDAAVKSILEFKKRSKAMGA